MQRTSMDNLIPTAGLSNKAEGRGGGVGCVVCVCMGVCVCFGGGGEQWGYAGVAEVEKQDD